MFVAVCFFLKVGGCHFWDRFRGGVRNFDGCGDVVVADYLVAPAG